MLKVAVIFLFCLFVFLQFKVINSYSQECDTSLKEPLESKVYEKNIPTQIDVKLLPSFQRPGDNVKGLLPMDARLRLQANSYVNAKTSKVGEYFKARVLEDFYLPIKPPMLLIPQGSWVRGRISKIKRPTLFSMSAEINLHLHQIVTPVGEVNTIDANLSIGKGILNSKGLLDPALVVGDIQRGSIFISKPDEKIIPKLISGFLIALITEESLSTINVGQELQVVLSKNIKLW